MRRFIALLLAAHFAALAPTTQAAAVVINSYRFSTAAPTYLVNQNLEAPGYDNGESWTAGGDPLYTVTVLRGTRSLKVVHGNQPSTSFTAQSAVYAFCDFYIDTLPTANSINGLDLGGATHDTYTKIDASGNVTLVSGGVTSSASATALSAGVHYYYWMGSTASGAEFVAISATTTKPTVDGSGAVYLTGTGDAGNIDTVYCYCSAGGNTTILVFDHILISTSPIGNNP